MVEQFPYEPDPTVYAELDKRFGFRGSGPDQEDRINRLRQSFRELSKLGVRLSPPCREQEQAMDALEIAQMKFVAAIMRREGP